MAQVWPTGHSDTSNNFNLSFGRASELGMTIQTKMFDGRRVNTRTYRNVIEGVNLAQHVEGFYAQRDSNKWGVLIQLKGKERILRRSFGNIENVKY